MEVHYKQNWRNNFNIWKLNSSILNNQSVKMKVKRFLERLWFKKKEVRSREIVQQVKLLPLHAAHPDSIPGSPYDLQCPSGSEPGRRASKKLWALPGISKTKKQINKKLKRKQLREWLIAWQQVSVGENFKVENLPWSATVGIVAPLGSHLVLLLLNSNNKIGDWKLYEIDSKVSLL